MAPACCSRPRRASSRRERTSSTERLRLGRGRCRIPECARNALTRRPSRAASMLATSEGSGPNPIDAVEKRPEPKRAYVTLRAEEVPLLLAAVPDAWRAVFAAALYTGLRKGELFGLRKSDVDLDHRTITVRRSYDRETTKGGHADAIPIAEALVPFLEEALAASTSEVVFPGPDGRMRSQEADPQKILRTALARAGLVDYWIHTCRRCKRRGEPHSERHGDDGLRTCFRCGMKLWASERVRAMRFHDLRHTTATLLLRERVDAHRVQRVL